MPHRQPTETNRGNLDSSPPRPISKKAKAALARVPLATLWPYAVWACPRPTVLRCAHAGVRAQQVAADRNRTLDSVGDWSLVLYHKQFRERCETNLCKDVRRLCRPSKRNRRRLLQHNEADTSRSDGARTKTSRGSGALADTVSVDCNLAPQPNSAL